MKKMIAVLLTAMMLCSLTVSLAEETNDYTKLPETPGSHIAVICFSATDNTWGIAEKIAAATGADLLRIEAEVPYTADDLRWTDDKCRANKEQNDDTCRPGIANMPESLDGYDVVFIGYPIWWGTIPQIIKTLVEAQTWEGKTIIPFCTSGSSGISTSIRDLKALNSGAEVLDSGRRFSAGASEQEVKNWLTEIGY